MKLLEGPHFPKIIGVSHLHPYYICFELNYAVKAQDCIREATETDHLSPLRYTLQLVEAATCLNKLKIIHSSISPENVFIGKDGLLKLFNFDNAKMSNSGLTHSKSILVIIIYAAREINRGRPPRQILSYGFEISIKYVIFKG